MLPSVVFDMAVALNLHVVDTIVAGHAMSMTGFHDPVLINSYVDTLKISSTECLMESTSPNVIFSHLYFFYITTWTVKLVGGGGDFFRQKINSKNFYY